MNSLEFRRLEMLTRVRDFGVTHAAEFPPASLGGEQFAVVGQVVEELTRQATAQSSSAGAARQGSTNKAAAREDLREDLQAVARTARAMSLDVPGLEDKFRLARGVGDQPLLLLARTFADDAEPLKAEFVKRGLSADFVEELREAAAAFSDAINRKSQGRGKHVAATAAIDGLVERGIRHVREIDALVRNTFASDPSALAAWESASHVERPVRKSRHKTTTTTTPAQQ